MLFSRRTIQRMLDENASWMPANPLREQVRRLNNPGHPTPLAPIWEVAILNALSKIVQIEHEPNLISKPDIVYRFDGETVIADITAVSDREHHRRNPVEELSDEFQRRMAPLILDGLKGGFSLSTAPENWRAQRRDAPAIQLRIPPVEQFERVIFTSAFDEFLRSLRTTPREHHSYKVDNAECRLIFSFNPKSAGWSFDKYRYTQSTVLDRNPVWNALKKKAEQLAKVTIAGHWGIIICDGDCDTFSDTTDWERYGADEIIRGFLKKPGIIEFVLALAPVHDQFRRDLRPDSHSYSARLIYREPNFPAWLAPIGRIVGNLPQPRQTALNARYEAQWKCDNKQWRQGSTFRGFCMVKGNQVTLSARDVLELLAGKLRQEEFEALPFMARENPFAKMLEEGRLITKVHIEPGEGEADDDYATFEFGPPDPAVSPFRAPGQRAHRIGQKSD